jgi:hypothetical protein
MMAFDSWEAVKQFAGEDCERACVPPQARKVLARFSEHTGNFFRAYRRLVEVHKIGGR